MIIERSYDIENMVREALKPYFSIYCKPLPVDFALPSLLVTVVGGNDDKKIDNFDVVLDARAYEESEAIELLLDAIATLKKIASEQTTNLRYVVINTVASWGNDPVRSNISLCTARLKIYTHKYLKEINTR